MLLRATTGLVLSCSLLSLAAQDNCDKRTFVTTNVMTSSAFTVLTYGSDLLDSLYWDFGDGQTLLQTGNIGTGSASHDYAGPGTYTVTLERWGQYDFPQNTTPVHCTHSITNVIYDHFTDSLCGGDFLTAVEGSKVTFSNRSVLYSPGFYQHSTQPALWDFGNGQQGIFLNRIYAVNYAPGTYTACLYYMGMSFNEDVDLFDCETCNTFTVGIAQGVEEQSEGEVLSLYPNPATSWVSVAGGLLAPTGITLLDQLGRSYPIPLLAHGGNELRVDVQGLAPGSYYLRLIGRAGARVLPFIKE